MCSHTVQHYDPGSLFSPETCQYRLGIIPPRTDVKLTTLSLFPNRLPNLTLVRRRHRLLHQTPTPVVEAFTLIHSSLQRISLPPKQVIRMSARSIGPKAPHERVRMPGTPQMVKAPCFPDRLVRHLRHADGVRSWAFRSWHVKAISCDGVVHVRLMIGAVEFLAVPTPTGSVGKISQTSKCEEVICSRWEVMRGEDAAWAWLVRKLSALPASGTVGCETLVSQADLGTSGARRVADRHAEPLRGREDPTTDTA